MKPGKSKGKKEQDQEMRMPAKEFDRIMGHVLGTPEKTGGLGSDRHEIPPAIPTENGPPYTDQPPLGAPAKPAPKEEPKKQR